MHQLPDHCVPELGMARLRLRDDLVCTPHTSAAGAYYMVEDPHNSRFFRLGWAEHTFVSLLDGRTSLHDALSHLAAVIPHHHLNEADAAGLCRWLVEMDLAHTVDSSRAENLANSARTLAHRQALSRWNPLVFRWPLGRPDRFFAVLADRAGWLFSPGFVIIWLVLVTLGGFQVLSDWNRFAASSAGIFAPGNWIWLGFCWVMLKFIHETAHGVACRHYGGPVRETGILFIFLAPLAYVDVTSSWRFRSRRLRIIVAAAGMVTELLVAAAASITWANTSDSWLNHFCYNLIVMSSLTTVLFNANPLMKFDGYYMLSDALAIPNLYVNGQQYLRYWAKRYLLGVRTSLPVWGNRQTLVIRLFGFAAFAWRVIITVGLTVAAATLFHGAGIVLAYLAIVFWLGRPTYGFLKYMISNESNEQPRRWRFLATVGTVTFASVLILMFVPWPGARCAPAVVEYSPRTIVRADAAGFVREVHMQSGDIVAAGQLLVTLENRQLATDLKSLEIDIRQSKIRGRRHEQDHELAAEQAEAKRREALLAQLEQKREQVNGLTIHAPCEGQIVGRNLDALVGRYLEPGAELLSIGNEQQKELRVSISQGDIDVFRLRIGGSVHIDLPRQPIWTGQFEKINPRATITPAHAGMAAIHGGPLPVKRNTQNRSDSPSDACELFAPPFTGIVKLNPMESVQLRAGQIGAIYCRPRADSIGQHLYHVASQWIQQKLQARGS